MPEAARSAHLRWSTGQAGAGRTETSVWRRRHRPRLSGYPRFPEHLRLVTCGGLFDDSTGHYRSNTIVFAALPT
jgi:hypothetical protein